MSGGAIVVAPVVLLAPVAAAVAGAGLAAALAVRAARAGTEATGRALEQFADQLECQARAQDDRALQARLWELAAGAVVATNQELRLLAARAERAGVRAPLPGPFDLTGHGLAGTQDWVASASEALASARAAVERAEADQQRRVLLGQLPEPADDSVTAADLLRAWEQTLASRRRPGHAGRPSPAPGWERPPLADIPADAPPLAAILPDAPRAAAARVDLGRVRAEIDTTLARLDLDATAAEREEAIRAAARAAKQRDLGASRTYLDALARRVDEVINPRAAGRRDAAGWLDALEHPVVAEAVAETTPPLPPCLGAIDRLRAIVRGDTDLTDADRRAARDALAWAHRQVERRRLREAMAETFARLGYAVTTGMQVHHTTALHVAREAWRDGHRAEVWIDEAGQVQWRLVELAPDAGGAASRCQDLNQSMGVIGEALAQRGFDAEVRVPAVPLQPVAAHTGSRGAGEYHDHDAGLASRQIDPTEER